MKNPKILSVIVSFFIFPAMVLAADQADTLAIRNKADQAEALYNKIYPYHLEYCAVTQITRRDGQTGGSGGHAVLYVKGACTTDSGTNGVPVPQIKVCEDNEMNVSGGLQIYDKNQGVGLSVNKTFENSNWVATPGRDLLIYGNLSADQTLTNDYKLSLARQIAPYFEGMTSLDTSWEKAPIDFTLAQKIALSAIDTDVAITAGRTAYCVKIPIKKEMLPDVVNEYNRLNQVAYKMYVNYKEQGGRRFVWSGFSNSCAHTAYNGIAATGMFAPKKINQNPLQQVFNLAIPSEVFRSLAERGNKVKLDDVAALYSDFDFRLSLNSINYLQARPGFLVSRIYWHKNNEVYGVEVCKNKITRKQVNCENTDPATIDREIDLPTIGRNAIGIDGGNILANPLLIKNLKIFDFITESTAEFMDDIVKSPLYTDVFENLKMYETKYARAIEKIERSSQKDLRFQDNKGLKVDAHQKLELGRFRNMYLEYLKKELSFILTLKLDYPKSQLY